MIGLTNCRKVRTVRFFCSENFLNVRENGMSEYSPNKCIQLVTYIGTKVGKSPYVSNGKGKTIFVRTPAIGYIYLQLILLRLLKLTVIYTMTVSLFYFSVPLCLRGEKKIEIYYLTSDRVSATTPIYCSSLLIFFVSHINISSYVSIFCPSRLIV